MPYQLRFFQQIVQGNLSPLYFPLDTAGLSGWYQHLSVVPATCTKQIHAQFQKEADHQLNIATLQARLLDQYHLPVFLAQQHQVQPYEDMPGEALLSQVLSRLSLQENDVVEWYHWQDEAGTVHLESYARYPVDTLSPEERRYHYYQQLLSEQIAILQQQMVAYVQEASSRKKATKYVQDHQQALSTYTALVLEHLEEPYPQVYTFSGEYNLPDVFKLILRKLEEMSSFLEQQFSQYLDLSTPVPYRIRVTEAFRMAKKLPAIEEALRALEKSLQKVLSQPLERIRTFAQKEVSYRQLQYYRRFVRELEKLVAEDQVSQESLVALLFRLNFNSPAFAAWLAAQLQDRLEGQETLEQQLEVLYYHRKRYRQLPVQPGYAYQPLEQPIDQQILSWIDEEITYLKEVEAVGIRPQRADPEPLPRVKTTLSVPQIALLLRLCWEVGIFPRQKKANLFRRFSRLLQTTRQEDLSSNALRDRYYKPDQHSIDVLKDKVIAMLNYLNRL